MIIKGSIRYSEKRKLVKNKVKSGSTKQKFLNVNCLVENVPLPFAKT